MAFEPEPSPRAFKLVNGEKTAISEGDILLSGRSASDNKCEYDSASIVIGAELPRSFKAGSIEISVGENCNLLLENLSFNSEIPDGFGEDDESGGTGGPVDSNEILDKSLLSSLDTGTSDSQNLLTIMSSIDNTAFASTRVRVNSKAKVLAYDTYLILYAWSKASYFDNGSSLLQTNADRQWCWNKNWWEEQSCTGSEYFSPSGDEYEVGTLGVFDMIAQPPETILRRRRR